MKMYEIVMKLIGPVQPVGESHEDAMRLANMKELTEFVTMLMTEISDAESCADREEFSMRQIGSYARDFLDEVRDI